jgi:homoserine dehydrogenase
MKLEGADFNAVLADAQQLGFAEAEPSLDVDGHDAAQKIGILASLAHGFWVPPERIHTEGIREVTPLDIQFAAQLGYTIKLIAMVKKFEAGKSSKSSRIQVSITPTLVPNSHVLANVNHVFNAILVRGDVVGDTLYYGRGAGQDATASSVLSDIADAALDLRCHTDQRVRAFVPHERDGKVVDIDDTVSRYYLRLSVIDKPGTLARIAALLGQSKIGISSVIQPEGHEGESVPLILMIHDASFSAMRKALTKIARLSVIKGAPVLFRVENFE